jgi:signal peptidase I
MQSATSVVAVEPEKHRRVSFVRWTISIILLVPLVVAWAAFLRGDLQSYKVISRSMEPALLVGDHLLLARESRYDDLKGKVIAFESADEYKQALTKRVIATGGDEVELKKGKLYINGKPEEGEFDTIKFVRGRKWTLQPDEIFVVGDNRNNSEDSIDHGPLQRGNLLGVICFRYWPFSRIGWI